MFKAQSLTSTTWATLGLGCAFSLIFVSLYVRDIEHESEFIQQGTPLGQVLKAEQDVSRRPSDRWLWTELSARNHVYENDTIRTGSHSEAHLSLGSQGEVYLHPDSLVVLTTQPSGIQINVASGELFLKGRVEAKIGDTRVSTKNGSLRLTRSEGEALQVQAESGEVLVKNSSGSTQLEEGSQLTALGDGRTQVKHFPLLRKTPLEGSRIEDSSAPLRFQYEIQEESSTPQVIHLQVSQHDKFEKLLVDAPLKAGEQDFSTRLPQGEYSWRLYYPTEQRALSTTGHFSVVDPPRLEWTHLPAPLRLEKTGVQWMASWNAIPQAESYELTFRSENRLLENFKLPSSVTRFVFHSPSGTLEKWLHQLKDTQNIALSVTLEVKGDQLAQKIPALSTPLSFVDARPGLGIQNARIALLESDWRKIQLSWQLEEGAPPAPRFEFAWGETSSLSLKESSLKISSEEFWSHLNQSEFPRVRSISPNGLPAPWKNFPLPEDLTRFLSLVHTAPQPLTPLNGSSLLQRSSARLALQWKAQHTGLYHPQEYELECVEESSEKTLKKRVKENSAPLPIIRPGSYTWKVRALWKDIGPGPWSDPQHYFLSPGAPLPAPRMRRPASSASQ